MKKMLQRWKLNPGMLLLAPVMQLICGLLGFGIVVLIFFVDGEAAPVYMGTLMTTFVPVMCAVIYMMGYGQQFHVAVSMGSTRKEFLQDYALKTCAAFTSCYVLTLLFWWAEQALYPVLFPGFLSSALPLDFLVDLRIVLPVIVFCVILSLFAGSLYARFGKKFWIVAYFIFMACCIGLPRLSHFEALPSFLANVPAIAWYGIGGIAAAAMLTTAVRFNRKQMVW